MLLDFLLLVFVSRGGIFFVLTHKLLFQNYTEGAKTIGRKDYESAAGGKQPRF